MSKNNDSSINKITKHFISPFAVGFYFTLVILVVALQYYEHASVGQSNVGFFLERLQWLHAQTVDARFGFRGPQRGSDRVAILAVDEKAASIRRWPWPRDLTAKAVEKAVELGAKVIATDMVFSEESSRPDVTLFEDLKKRGLLPADKIAQYEESLEKLNGDKIFGETIGNVADHFILGNFYLNGSTYRGVNEVPGFTQVCQDMIFKNTREFKAFDAGEPRVSAVESGDFQFSDVMESLYLEHIEEIKNDVYSSAPGALTLSQHYQLEKTIAQKLSDFCAFDFLNFEGDKDDVIKHIQSGDADGDGKADTDLWSVIREADKNIQQNTIEEWAATYKDHSLNNAITDASDWTVNISELTSRAKYNGYFNAFLDNDGVIRQTKLVSRTGTLYIPSIAFMAYLVDQNLGARLNVNPLKNDPSYKGINGIQLYSLDTDEDTHMIPTLPDAGFYINYAGPRHMFPHVSLADILDDTTDVMPVTYKFYDNETGRYVDSANEMAPDDKRKFVHKKTFMKDKVFFLGATAVGIFDLRNTPYDGNFPGVETHANVLSNLLEKKYLRPHPEEKIYMLGLLLVLGLLMSFILAHSGALTGLIVTATTFFSIGYLDMEFLFKPGYLTTLVLPLLLLGGLYVTLTFFKYFTEERAKRELRSTFNKYVSPAIVEEVLRDPKNLELGGRKERITVFFSDVRGFTTISEKLDPRALSDLLNSYLTPMTELVFKNKGTLDKYMGDAIMAFFGAPIHYEDHAKYACRCALQSLEKLEELKKIYEKKKLPMIDIGIGLNTGECSVGNMGSETVRNYTVMGDAVNLASRLEGINKTYGTHIIISEFTHADVHTDFLCREVDWVRVKGKLKPVKIFELLAEGKGGQKTSDMAKYFGDGYNYYHQKQFEQAIREFEKAIGISPDDATSKIYIERCREFIDSPPPEEWDGVFIMKSK